MSLCNSDKCTVNHNLLQKTVVIYNNVGESMQY